MTGKGEGIGKEMEKRRKGALELVFTQSYSEYYHRPGMMILNCSVLRWLQLQ